MSEFSNEGFIQEFLEEAKEHLFLIHNALLALERSITKNGQEELVLPRQETVEQLFRSFHTLKGLSAMIGLQPAAELSHSMESVLLGIQKTEIEVTNTVLQTLFDGVEKLESVISTLSNPQSTIPGIEAEVAALSAFTTGSKPKLDAPTVPVESAAAISLESFLADILKPYPEIRAGLTERDHPAILDAILKGRSLSVGIFAPTTERSQEGVNVGQIRKELATAGQLIKSIPLVTGSTVRFAFLVASSYSITPSQYPYLDWVILLPGRRDAQQDEGSAPVQHLAVEPESHSRIAQTNLVRVDMHRLDELIQMVGELVVQRNAILDVITRLSGTAPGVRRELSHTTSQMDRTLRRLRESILRTRMVPLAEVFSQMPLAIRDLARATGKDVHLFIDGEETKIDKMLVERLFDPLLHLVRNAVTHGIETPAERSVSGKPMRGQIILRGKPEGDHIRVEVSDDGRGIDREKIADRAIELGLIDSGQEISDTEMLDLICRPGFSTQAKADLGAGRGVGMDVVKRMVYSMSGALNMATQQDQGTTFTIRLPLSLVILDAILVQVEEETYAIPQGMIEEVIEINPEEIAQIESGELLPYKDNALVIYRLARLFDLPPTGNGAAKHHCYGLIADEGDHRTVLLVDRLIGLREVVIRPIIDPLISCPGVTGATELGNGQVVLILNPSDLLEVAKHRQV
jgi:two-component system, chemotaxis family, sensor kinase CheA